MKTKVIKGWVPSSWGEGWLIEDFSENIKQTVYPTKKEYKRSHGSPRISKPARCTITLTVDCKEK